MGIREGGKGAVRLPRILVLIIVDLSQWTRGVDGLDLGAWLAAHGPGSAAPAITGTFPCCGCWAVKDSNASADPLARPEHTPRPALCGAHA